MIGHLYTLLFVGSAEPPAALGGSGLRRRKRTVTMPPVVAYAGPSFAPQAPDPAAARRRREAEHELPLILLGVI